MFEMNNEWATDVDLQTSNRFIMLMFASDGSLIVSEASS